MLFWNTLFYEEKQYLHQLPKQKLIEYATMSGVLAHTTYGDSPIVSKEEILEAMLENNDIKR